MSLSFLRALNPFAAPADAAALRSAKAGGIAGILLAGLSVWDVFSLHLDRQAFLDAYANNLTAYSNPAVVAQVQGMGPTMIAVSTGFGLVIAAILLIAAMVQFRRGGIVPLAVFAVIALYLSATISMRLLADLMIPRADAETFMRWIVVLLALISVAAGIRGWRAIRRARPA
jgi:hypothetical protein